MDEHGENNMDDQTNDTNYANSVDNSDGSPDNPAFSAPLLRDSKGRFVKGTGTRGHLGGRPQGAKDKLSVQFLDVMQAVIEEKGTEMMMTLAEENPAAALAIISRSLPQKAMQEAIDGVEKEGNEITQVNINLVSAPTPRLSDTRSEAQLTEQQRGLGSAPQRIERIAESAVVADVVATQQQADDEAAEAERERVRKRNDAVRAHGGLTGRRPRTSAPDELPYPDDYTI